MYDTNEIMISKFNKFKEESHQNYMLAMYYKQ